MSNSSLVVEKVQIHANWRDYLALTKPRVISLLLFTALASLFIAAGNKHNVTLELFLAVSIGGYMAAGAANTFNMIIDRDIDLTMVRTASRPIVTSTVSTRSALIFATLLAVSSFLILWRFGGILSALMSEAGLGFYVVIYTLLLKRRTWRNIVIGGAAGCFPVLVGWAADQHQLPLMAWVLFGIVFFWTPVHFWALALLIKDDYEAASIPMLPVVRGDRHTVKQIGGYMVVTILVTFTPFLLNFAGILYFVSAVVLNLILLRYVFLLHNSIERKTASRLFHFSMLYLALLFLALALDRYALTPLTLFPTSI